jgi:AraC family transcriptional regulator
MTLAEGNTPAQLALWYVERHLDDPLTLDRIAEVAGVSRSHLARAFTSTMGRPVLSYVRARRLSAAARTLAAGATAILDVALSAGYSSHEAFTRAFRDQFGITPDGVRERGHIQGLPLQEAEFMQTQAVELSEPRFLEAPSRTFAGLSSHYSMETSGNIPAQWQRLTPWFDRLPSKEPGVSWGVIFNATDEGTFDYLCGVEVAPARLPPDIVALALGPQRYAVFAHPGHVSQMRSVIQGIWNRWLPRSGRKAAPAAMLESYGTGFDARTGNGGFEIWLPLA